MDDAGAQHPDGYDTRHVRVNGVDDRTLPAAALVALVLGLSCLGALVGSLFQSHPAPLAGQLVIAGLGAPLTFFGVAFLVAGVRQRKDGPAERLGIGPAGMRLARRDQVKFQVSWDELARVTVVLSGTMARPPRPDDFTPAPPNQPGYVVVQRVLLRLEPWQPREFRDRHVELVPFDEAELADLGAPFGYAMRVKGLRRRLLAMLIRRYAGERFRGPIGDDRSFTDDAAGNHVGDTDG